MRVISDIIRKQDDLTVFDARVLSTRRDVGGRRVRYAANAAERRFVG